MNQQTRPSTRSVHVADRVDPTTRSFVPPIVQNASYAYEDLDTWRTVALDQAEEHIRSRNSNSTTDLLEEKAAAMGGAESATSFATGVGAISTTFSALWGPGQRTVSVRDACGATYLHLAEILPPFGIRCDICDTEDHKALESAIAQGCVVRYLESPTNPRLKVLDLARLMEAAHQVGAITIVDNTCATLINQHLVALRADLVIHSATNYLGGHSDVLGGVLCGRKDMVEKVYLYRKLPRPSIQAHAASLLLRSLKTLGLRLQRQNENALAMARCLEGHPRLERVYYPGLESHPGHEIARRQMRGYGGVLSFAVKGGLEAIARYSPRLRYAYMVANLGQVETIVGPRPSPATSSARKRNGPRLAPWKGGCAAPMASRICRASWPTWGFH